MVRLTRWTAAAVVGLVCLLTTDVAEAQRGQRRGPSPQQIKKMQEQMQYQQQEMLRVQSEMAAKEKELRRLEKRRESIRPKEDAK